MVTIIFCTLVGGCVLKRGDYCIFFCDVQVTNVNLDLWRRGLHVLTLSSLSSLLLPPFGPSLSGFICFLVYFFFFSSGSPFLCPPPPRAFLTARCTRQPVYSSFVVFWFIFSRVLVYLTVVLAFRVFFWGACLVFLFSPLGLQMIDICLYKGETGDAANSRAVV